jgi:aspartyl-tRNA(Asn)/glutamyl-tRNA(Gln) amidotransferase subunit A
LAGAPRRGAKGLKVGIIRRFYETDLPASAEVIEQMAEAERLLADLGCSVGTANCPPLAAFNAANRLIITAEAFALHEAELTSRPEAYSRAFRVRVMAGGVMRAVDYIQAQRHRRSLAAELNALFDQFDVLVTAATPGPAPKLADVSLDEGLARPTYAAPANISGGPAMSVCSGFAPNGLPLGLQIMGPPFGEASVLALGHAVEEASGSRSRRPSL